MAGLDRVVTLVFFDLSTNAQGEHVRTERTREEVWAERTDRGQTTDIGLIRVVVTARRSYRVRYRADLDALITTTTGRIQALDLIDGGRTLRVQGVYEDSRRPRRRYLIIDVED